MSSFLYKDKNEDYVKEIESMEICRYRINDVCCNDQCDYLGDFPHPFCKCESLEDCKHFEKEE